MLSLIESISGIAFVRVPASIKPNEPCAWIEHEGNTLPLKMPLAVTITNANVRVRETPRLLKQHPYDNGWILRLKPDTTSPATDTLVTPSDATAMYKQQAAEFQNDCQVALKEKQSRVGATLYDGGTPLETIEDIVGSQRYLEILTQRFLRL
jgi:glycine cleavage system H lipoate-binding protein